LAARRWVIDNTGITNIGGYANRNIAGTNTLSKHALGKAIDVMTYNKAIHQKIANEFVSNAGRWGTDNVITGTRIWNRRGWHGYNGIPHNNHIHVDFFKQGGLVGKMLGGLGAAGLADGGVVKGGRGGLLAHIGEGRRDELVTPLRRGWQRGGGDDKIDRLIAAIEQHGLTGHTFNFDIDNPVAEKPSQTTNRVLQRVAALPLV
jgi:hypothetical protein